jgi:ComF family protein
MANVKSILAKLSYFYRFKVLNFSCCAMCEFPTARPICHDCLQLLQVLPINENLISQVLGNNLDVVYFIAPYIKPWQTMLIDYKYNHQVNLKWALGYLLKLHIDKLALELDYIIPVPIHRRKKQQRGFDHILGLLSYYLATGGEINIASNLVTKKIYHPSQVRLNKEERINNLYNTFCATNAVAGKSILIIDDVYTTGATLSEMAKELKNHGAHKVYALVLLHNDVKITE